MSSVAVEAPSSINESARALASEYDRATHWVSNLSGASDPMLHVHAGLASFVLAWLLLRRPLSSGLPFAVAFGLAVLNEGLDYLHQGLRWPEAGLDLLITVFWPFVLTIAARARS